MIASVTVAIRVTDDSGTKSVEVARQSSKAREALQDAVGETLSSVLGVPVPFVLPSEPEPVRASVPASKRRKSPPSQESR